MLRTEGPPLQRTMSRLTAFPKARLVRSRVGHARREQQFAGAKSAAIARAHRKAGVGARTDTDTRFVDNDRCVRRELLSRNGAAIAPALAANVRCYERYNHARKNIVALQARRLHQLAAISLAGTCRTLLAHEPDGQAHDGGVNGRERPHDGGLIP